MYHIPCGAVRARRRDFFPGKMASNDASLYSLAAGSDASEGDPFELDGEPEVVSNQQPTNLQQPAQQQPTQQQQQADAGASGGASARQQDDTGELRKYLRTVSATAQPDLELDDESLTTLDNLFEKLVGQVMARQPRSPSPRRTIIVRARLLPRWTCAGGSASSSPTATSYGRRLCLLSSSAQERSTRPQSRGCVAGKSAGVRRTRPSWKRRRAPRSRRPTSCNKSTLEPRGRSCTETHAPALF